MRLSGVQVERLRDFGEVRLALGWWRTLNLIESLGIEIDPGRDEAPWSTVASILTIERFCEPSSEVHIEQKWYRSRGRSKSCWVSRRRMGIKGISSCCRTNPGWS